MNTKTKNFKTRLIAVITVALLTLSLLLPFVYTNNAVNASADTGEIYYFSDNEDSVKYDKIIKDNTEKNFEHIIFDEFDDANKFNDFLSRLDIYENSHVILELRRTEINSSFAVVLEDWFCLLKTYYKCKIMFICDTSEERFSRHTSFLRYVDIHVNTDTFLPFFDNAMQRIEQKEPGDTTPVNYGAESIELNNRNIILDFSLSEYYKETNWFLDTYLFPYLKYNLRMDYNSTYEETLEKCNLNNVHVYLFTGYSEHSQYLDMLTREQYNIKDICGGAYAMGTDFKTDFLDLWLEDIKSYELPLFFYDSTGTYISESNLDKNVFCCGTSDFFERAEFSTPEDKENGRFTMADILVEFINDGDLTVFNNWEGVCVVTSKPLFPGKNGWMGSVRDLSCYQTDMDK